MTAVDRSTAHSGDAKGSAETLDLERAVLEIIDEANTMAARQPPRIRAAMRGWLRPTPGSELGS